MMQKIRQPKVLAAGLFRPWKPNPTRLFFRPKLLDYRRGKSFTWAKAAL